MPNVIMLNVIMPSVILLSVAMLSVVAPYFKVNGRAHSALLKL
jgi:hypothetical protein